RNCIEVLAKVNRGFAGPRVHSRQYRPGMVTPRLHYAAYADTGRTPNVVVDGAPNDATVVVLSHWPGLPTPEGCAADSSTQMVFRYLDRGADLHGDAAVVTNDHFDQDGLAAIYA